MLTQARYWILTIPVDSWDKDRGRPQDVVYIKGQMEQGITGYRHWQLLVVFSKKVRLATVKRAFGDRAHAEPTRSSAADAYVWKDDTAVAGTRFELGHRAIRRNNATDWAAVRANAVAGNFDPIPDDIYMRYYGNLVRVARDNMRPVAMERTVIVYWGVTGTGKTRRAYAEAGEDCYFKIPTTKWWDGYRGQENVVIDEFRGAIDIAHLLRWLDRTPVSVEVKGGAVPFRAKNIWLTSNLSPQQWYPGLDAESMDALIRKLGTIVHFDGLGEPPYVSPHRELPAIEEVNRIFE